MSPFRKAVFHTTVAHLRDLPQDSLREVAFAGRSNAGKSSAINTLVSQTRLAFVSKTPGRTQNLNYFSLGDGKFFVDLPGYGFAKTPEEIRGRWEDLLAPYLLYREPLTGLILIMDCRHPMTDLDKQMIAWFSQTGKPIHILLSKADKLTRQEQAKMIRGVEAALAEMGVGTGVSAQLFSSLKRDGLAGAMTILCDWLDMTPEKEGTPPSSVRKTARIKNRSAMGWSARTAKKPSAAVSSGKK
ncbi:MAG: ribosome biogenesis GTP-binding protein YihA/YsxC [Candidatus Accumulibacter sp.]|nr:ribosome biogenesis GTP-binding protein YihA/YsxC [Accumulibacter sp.]